MTESHEPAGGSAQVEAPVVLVVNPGSEAEIALPIHDRLFIGRECGGIDAGRRYLIDEEAVSRTHLELRFDAARDQAWAIDRSTNGTRVNGARIERSVQLLLRPGDRLTVGSVEFELRSTRDWLRSRANSIEGGSSEVQMNIIAKRVLGLPD